MPRRVHFVGVGGYSMSGLAEVLAARGDRVSGSDIKPSSRTERLLRKGIPVAFGHRAENAEGADVVVYNSDVPADNPELAAARTTGATIVHRSDILAEVMAGGRAIAVTGTHGKTTVSTLIGHILIGAGEDPTVLVGGEVDAWDGGVRIGRGPWVVAETDESDGSFLKYRPEVAVVTNVEPEHLDHYHGSFEAVKAAVKTFLAHVNPGGAVIVSADDPFLRHVSVPGGRAAIRYGTHPAASFSVEVTGVAGEGHRFRVTWDGKELGEAEIPIPGRHNVQNAAAALAAAMAAGVRFEAAAAALAGFKNAHRRFEVHFRGRDMVVVDDYAHHPTEIRAVLEAAREIHPGRLVVAFQPQRYARTQSLFEAFVGAFDEADLLYLLDIYAPPGEVPIPGVSSAELARRIGERGQTAVVHLGTPDELASAAKAVIEPGDLFITMGAGDIFLAAERLAADLRRVG